MERKPRPHLTPEQRHRKAIDEFKAGARDGYSFTATLDALVFFEYEKGIPYDSDPQLIQLIQSLVRDGYEIEIERFKDNWRHQLHRVDADYTMQADILGLDPEKTLQAVHQMHRYLSDARRTPESEAQAEFKAYWRHRIDYAPRLYEKPNVKFAYDYYAPRPSQLTFDESNEQDQFSRRAETLGLEPIKTWEEIVKAAAYVRHLRKINCHPDLSSGFTEHDLNALGLNIDNTETNQLSAAIGPRG